MKYIVRVDDENGENRFILEMDQLDEERNASIPYALLLHAAYETEKIAVAEGAPPLKELLAALLEDDGGVAKLQEVADAARGFLSALGKGVTVEDIVERKDCLERLEDALTDLDNEAAK